MKKEIIKYALPRQKFNINVLDITPAHSLLGLHRHKETEIIKISKGSLRCEFADQSVIVKEGEILIINALLMMAAMFFLSHKNSNKNQ